jgi:hypothetical protein
MVSRGLVCETINIFYILGDIAKTGFTVPVLSTEVYTESSCSVLTELKSLQLEYDVIGLFLKLVTLLLEKF